MKDSQKILNIFLKKSNLPTFLLESCSKMNNLSNNTHFFVPLVTDTCNTRVWEKTYNVNLESLKGGKKHLRHSEYTIYTDGSKKQERTGGGFVIYNYNKQIHTQSFKMQISSM